MKCSVTNSKGEQCKNDAPGGGICSTHSYRFRRYGDVQADRPIRKYTPRQTGSVERYPGDTDVERFWARVLEDDDHWLWAGSFNKNGEGVETDQGQLQFEGFNQSARRVAYILTHGPIPDEVRIVHTCTTWSCVKHTEAVNPDGTAWVRHLEGVAA
ncbi:HNH endonuclease [Streptomyces phage Daudau]|uniref:HNH endonuclease n=1 Tax=Streptomyces phage Daudau TaxID=2041206 RepID=A0A291LH92_9CAUD|nr:HNH endonuclease [Streptomyces phage Daudau]ATI18766.1 HNH endonuclease [Streptomyces phage Daudau]